MPFNFLNPNINSYFILSSFVNLFMHSTYSLLLYFVNPEYFQIVKLFYYFIFAFVIFRLSIIGHELAHLFMAKMTNAKILGIEFGNINDLIIYEKNSNLRNNRFRCEYIKCKCFKL